tara:strand:+ start:551 stop:1117 length:567 start_codon:yes stop_codon:yes gene_type:complete
MRYGEAYRIVEFNETILGKIESMLANMDLQIRQSKLYQEKLSEENPKRVSNQAWINEISFCKYFLGLGMKINETCLWNFDIKGIEPIQYGIYGKGGKYDWHADQHKKPIKGLVRKISMTLFMSDPEEYEGGEFDLELRSPDFNSRFDTFKLKKGAAIFFKSDAYHRVRPVSSGVRKSIVAWYNGPSFR